MRRASCVVLIAILSFVVVFFVSISFLKLVCACLGVFVGLCLYVMLRVRKCVRQFSFVVVRFASSGPRNQEKNCARRVSGQQREQRREREVTGWPQVQVLRLPMQQLS